MRALLLTAVLALTLAGCASTTTNTSSTSGTKAPSNDMGMMMPKTVEVSMMGSKFVNQTITVHVGDKIHWTNKDMVGHSVTATSGATFDSNPNCLQPVPAKPVCMASGDTFTYTAEKEGEIAYHCKVQEHASMTGKIVVLPMPPMNMTQ